MAAKGKDSDEEEKPEGEGAEGEGVELPKKKVSGKKMMLFIILGVILLLGGVSAALYFTGMIGGKKEPAAEGEEHAAEGEGEHGEKKGPIYYELPLSPINLQSDGRRPAFLKLKVTLELTKEEDREAITNSMPRIVDSFQMYLRELSKEELQGSAGLERLREELRLRVNAAVAPVQIKDVLFTDILFGQ